MDWFLYDRDLCHERVKKAAKSEKITRKFTELYRALQKSSYGKSKIDKMSCLSKTYRVRSKIYSARNKIYR